MDLNHTLCYLAPSVDIFNQEDVGSSHVEVKTGKHFRQVYDRHRQREDVMVMTDLWMQPRPMPRKAVRSRKNDVGEDICLATFSHAQRRAYMASSTGEETN